MKDVSIRTTVSKRTESGFVIGAQRFILLFVVLQDTVAVCAHCTLAAFWHGISIKDVQEFAPISLFTHIVQPKTTYDPFMNLFERPFHFPYPVPSAPLPINEAV